MAVAPNASLNAAAISICRCSRRPSIELPKNQRHQFLNNHSIPIGFYHPLLLFRHSIKAQAAEHWDHPIKAATSLSDVVENLWVASPKLLKEFPWKESKDLVLQRLLVLGKKALKLSIILLFGLSFASDVSLSVARNRELLIPMGLFIGVALADVLRECSLELFSSSLKNQQLSRHLLGIGSFFISVKLIPFFFNKQGWLLLSHISNGGMMQVLWLAKWLWRADSSENHAETILDGQAINQT